MLLARCGMRNCAGSAEIKVSCLERQVHRHQISAVREHDDREAIVREALNCGAKADSLAVVPHPATAFVWIQKPPEAIFSRRSRRLLHAAVGHFDGCERGT